jgi:phage terminase Nu1 subunit (DNA packaging protein)
MRRILARKQHPPAPRDPNLLERGGLINSDELATFLGVPLATLDTWASRGGGPPFHKVGVYRRYDGAEVKAWLAENHFATSKEPAA